MALSYLVLRGVRDFQEQHNLDIAIENLLSRKEIVRYREDGMNVYELKLAS